MHNPHSKLFTTGFLIYFCVQMCVPIGVLAEELTESGTSIPQPGTAAAGLTEESLESSESLSSLSSSSSSTSSHPHVVISEVMWMGTDVSTADEFLEIAGIAEIGVSTSPISLSGWTLTALNSKGQQAVIARFPMGLSIAAGEFLVISNYSVDQSRLSTVPAFSTTAMSLPNTKLYLELRNASGDLVDAVDDGVGAPFAGANPSGGGTKASMERIDLFATGIDKTNWQSAVLNKGFDQGVPIFGTPGFSRTEMESSSSSSSLSEFSSSSESSFSSESSPSSISSESSTSSTSSTSSYSSTSSDSSFSSFSSEYSIPLQPYSKIKINELLSNPIGSDITEWIELKNTASEPVSLSGMVIRVGTVAHTIHGSESDMKMLNSGSLILLRHSEVGFSLNNAGATVKLETADRIVIDEVTYPALPEEVSFGRNAEGIFQTFCVPTPTRENELILPTPLISLQSGNPVGVDPVTLNLSTIMSSGSLAGATCRYDFGDGFTSDSCNPGSHTMRVSGSFTVKLTLTDHCINTVEQRLEGNVSAKPFTVHSKKPVIVKMQAVTTPECVPSAFSGVVINEVIPNPLGDEKEGEWIELKNYTDRSISLCGWSVDDEQGGSKPYSLSKLQLPPQSFRILPRMDTGIALNNDHDTVRVIAPFPSGGTGVLVSLQYDNAPSDQSYARTVTDSYEWTSVLTPGAENEFQALKTTFEPSVIHITGAMPNPTGDDTYGEWIELENTAGFPVWLNGWSIQDSSNKKKLKLDGTVLSKKQKRKIVLDRSGLKLINSHGTVFLLDSEEVIRSVFTWKDAGENEVMRLPQNSLTKSVILDRVLDGDTIVVTDGSGATSTVRLLGIDALEMHDEDSEKLAFAFQSYELLKSLLKDKKLELQFDTDTSDKYGRTLAYVFVDGADVQQEMLTHGLTYAYRRFKIVKEDEYIAYEKIARDAKVGIWGNAGITDYLNKKIEQQEHYADAENGGLKVSFEEKNSVMPIGSSVKIGAIPFAKIFVSEDGKLFDVLSGSLLIDKDKTFYAYASMDLLEETGSLIHSDIVKQTYVLQKDSYPMSVFISEVYPSPKKGEEEWVELWNSGDRDVSLAGWQLDDVKDGGSKPWIGDTSAVIPAGGYIVLASSVTHLTLNNSGDDVRLISPDGHVVDKISHPKIKTGSAYARDIEAQKFCSTSEVTPSSTNICSTQKKAIKKAVKSKSTNTKRSSKIIKKPSVSAVAGSGVYAALRAQVVDENKYQYLQNESFPKLIISIILLFLCSIAWFIFRIVKKSFS